MFGAPDARTSSCDLALVLKIALVPNDDNGEIVLVLYA